MKNILLELFVNLLVGLITFVATKMYIGHKNFKGIKNAARLNKDCYHGGIINIFPNRKAYSQHKDHGTSSEYILKAEHNILYIGFWLASGIEMGNLKESIKKLISEQKTVTLVFLNPYNPNSIETCSNYIGVSSESIKIRINTALGDILKFKNELPEDEKHYLIIKTHNIPLSTSAFIIDYNKTKKCRILLDYKIYNCSREDSYGIEFENTEKIITQKILKSYRNIDKQSKEIHNLSDIHSNKS